MSGSYSRRFSIRDVGAVAQAQQPTKIPRVGFLYGGRNDGFRLGMRELGYVEGKNIIFEYAMVGESFTRAPARAAGADLSTATPAANFVACPRRFLGSPGICRTICEGRLP